LTGKAEVERATKIESVATIQERKKAQISVIDGKGSVVKIDDGKV
jgi:hypothetical protein